MFRRRFGSRLALLGISACVPQEAVEVQFPDSVGYWAAELGSNEAAYSPLLRRGETLGAMATESPVFVGWTKEALPDLPESAFEAPLAEAVACEPLLPTPSWTSDGQDRSLTAPWVTCPTPRVAAELVCEGVSQPCAFQTSWDGCRLRLTSCVAVGWNLSMLTSGHGRVCEIAGMQDCLPTEGVDLGAFDCAAEVGRCRVELFEVPDPPFVVRSRQRITPAVEVTPIDPESADTITEKFALDALRYSGGAIDVAKNGEVILAVSQPHASGGFREGCSVRHLDAFDVHTGELVGSSTTSECVEVVTREIGSGGFVGLTPTGLVRISPQGRATSFATLPVSGRPVDVVTANDRYFIATTPYDDDCQSALLELNPLDATWKRWTLPPPSECTGSQLSGLAVLSDRTVVATTRTTEIVMWFDRESGEVKTSGFRQGFGANYVRPARPEVLPELGATVAGALGNRTTVVVVDPEGFQQNAESFERRGWATAFSRTDSADGLLAGVYSGLYGSWVARFDGRSPRFEPGVPDVGVGPIGRIVQDGVGGYWLLLPWDGELVHIVPHT